MIVTGVGLPNPFPDDGEHRLIVAGDTIYVVTSIPNVTAQERRMVQMERFNAYIGSCNNMMMWLQYEFIAPNRRDRWKMSFPLNMNLEPVENQQGLLNAEVPVLVHVLQDTMRGTVQAIRLHTFNEDMNDYLKDLSRIQIEIGLETTQEIINSVNLDEMMEAALHYHNYGIQRG